MKTRAMAMALFLVPAAAFADMYKCKTESGGWNYQEQPCGGAQGQPVKIKPAPAAPAAINGFTDPGSQKMANDAYERAMAARDYSRALAFATTEKQRQKAQEQLGKKDQRCTELKIKATQARADAKGKGGRLDNAADAAEDLYRSECR